MPYKNLDKAKISIVMPTYKSEQFIAQSVREKLAVLDTIENIQYEMIVVVDGKNKRVSRILKGMKNRNIKIMHYEANQGKGFAVKYGIMNSSGDYIGYIDSGRDLPASILPKLINSIRTNKYDIVAGTKWHDEADTYYPLLRKIYSKGYNAMVKFLLGIQLKDTQTGAKFYTKAVVKDVVPKMLVKRFAFESEFLAIANNHGFKRIKEIPVNIMYDNQSTVKLKDGLRSVWDTLAVFYRLKILHYYDRQHDYHVNKTRGEFNTLRIIL